MNVVERAKAIVFTPGTEWTVIEQEPGRMWDLYVPYVAILAAIPELANFVGQSVIGAYRPVGSSLLRAVFVYVLTFAVVFVVAVVIQLLAPRFGGRKNWANAFKLSVYSHTPIWLAGIFLLLPGLSFLLLLGGLLAFYLLWIGLPQLMHVRGESALPYAAIVTACVLVPTIVLSML
jgi:Yip1 domain